jgi:hypothetical protein
VIAKRVPRTKGTSSPARLVRYMVAAEGGLDPRSWSRTADYILNSGTTHQGEKVGGVRVTNCGTDDPAAATVLIEATQAANTRSKADKTYHLVFSFPPGEQPPLEVLHAIEDELCASIGLADHQRISAVHIDTDHLHVHVAINKVHPTGFQNIEPYYDKQRLMEACESLEQQYDLQRTNHGLNQENSNDRQRHARIRLAPEQRPDERTTLFREYLRKSHDLAFGEKPKAETLNGLRNLSGCRMAHTLQGAALLLSDDARDGMEQPGKEPADGLRRAGNGDRGNAGARLTDAMIEIERQSGVETLTGYVARELAPVLMSAPNWQTVHDALAEHGLTIKPQGAGLVIGDAGVQLWTKASSCGRDLSMKALTDRLGPFEPSAQSKHEPRKLWTPQPRQHHPSSAALFAQYQRERQAHQDKRKKGLVQLRQESVAYREQLSQWRKTQYLLLKAGGKGATRRIMASTIRTQADVAKAQQRKAQADKRKVLIAATTLPSWNDWLTQKATAGDLDALAILRSREEREQKMRGDLLTAANAEKAKAIVMASLRPQARKDGAMAYRTADNGLVVDRATHVQAQRATAGAAFIALSLAAERFEGQALIVEGSAEFRQQVAQFSALHGLNVRFADPAMEQTRQAAITARPQVADRPAAQPTNTPPKPAVSQESAVDHWIKQRNEAREKISSIDYNRLWTSSDAGKATYQGRRRMDDGSEVLLLKRGDEMLVKPAGPRVVAKASKWKLGCVVELDARGRFIDNNNTVER